MHGEALIEEIAGDEMGRFLGGGWQAKGKKRRVGVSCRETHSRVGYVACCGVSYLIFHSFTHSFWSAPRMAAEAAVKQAQHRGRAEKALSSAVRKLSGQTW
jgi:hypothetical protein